MSTKTTFKRISLVAVAALGLGVLSVVPSSAAVNADALTVANTAGTAATAFSVNYGETVTATTSAIAKISYLPSSLTDSMSVTASLVSAPAGAVVLPRLALVDTVSAQVYAGPGLTNEITMKASADTNGSSQITSNTASIVIPRVASAITTARYYVFLGSSATAGPTVAGDYVVKLTPAVTSGAGTLNATAQTITITVGKESVSADATTTVYMASGTTSPTATTDLVPVMVAKSVSATSAPVANILVTEGPAATARESFTATISGPGTLGVVSGTSLGRSLTVKKGDTVYVYADGTAGLSTITLTGVTSGLLFGTKTVTFTGTAIAKFVATVVDPVIGVAGTSGSGAISVVAYDADGKQIYSPTISSISSATSVISNNYKSCAWSPTDLVSYCDLTAVATGTASITLTTAASAASTTQGDGVTTTQVTTVAGSIRVASATVASVKMSFDKGTYQPGEKATLTVELLDSNGAAVAPNKYDNIFYTGGISSTYAFYTGSDTTTATYVTTSDTTAKKTFTLYMPLQSTTVKVSAIAGSALPASVYVGAGLGTVYSATVVVGNNSAVDAATDAANEATDAANAATDAALAAADAADAATAAAQDASDAVAALSATVAKLFASIKSQNTS
jgi:hypothetical protein